MLSRTIPSRAITSLFNRQIIGSSTSYNSPIIDFKGLKAMGSGNSSLHTTTPVTSPRSDVFSPNEFRPFPIARITKLSHNAKSYKISLPSAEDEMGFSVSSFLMVKGATTLTENGTLAFEARPYTPTSTNFEKGSFELVVKSYPNGKVSSYLDGLKVGDKIEVKGPINKLRYVANMKKNIGMLAGGSGITPMLQILKEIARLHDVDTTNVHLVFANNSVADILLKPTLDDLAAKHANITVTYIVTSSTSGATAAADTKKTTGTRTSFAADGHVSAELLASTMPAPSEDTLIYVCGPPGFMKAISGDKTPDKQQGELAGLLKAAGYTENMVFKF